MKEFEMTKKQWSVLTDAMSPIPVNTLKDCTGLYGQARANNAWACLGRDMRFDYRTVKPSSKGDRFFSAEPTVCEGIDLGDGRFSGCDQSGGDCPTCGE
jgi:hypothetical protein